MDGAFPFHLGQSSEQMILAQVLLWEASGLLLNNGVPDTTNRRKTTPLLAAFPTSIWPREFRFAYRTPSTRLVETNDGDRLTGCNIGARLL